MLESKLSVTNVCFSHLYYRNLKSFINLQGYELDLENGWEEAQVVEECVALDVWLGRNAAMADCDCPACSD